MVMVRDLILSYRNALLACRCISGAVAGAAISAHPKIRKVGFTGSLLTGRKLLKASGETNLKVITLELGGKSPTIIFDDADFEQTLKWAARGILYVFLITALQPTLIELLEQALTWVKHVLLALVSSSKNLSTQPSSKGSLLLPKISQITLVHRLTLTLNTVLKYRRRNLIVSWDSLIPENRKVQQSLLVERGMGRRDTSSNPQCLPTWIQRWASCRMKFSDLFVRSWNSRLRKVSISILSKSKTECWSKVALQRFLKLRTM